jgi:outer membrane biosynthesis protein TonB
MSTKKPTEYIFQGLAPCSFTVNGTRIQVSILETFKTDLATARLITAPAYPYRAYYSLKTPLPVEEPKVEVVAEPKVEPKVEAVVAPMVEPVATPKVEAVAEPVVAPKPEPKTVPVDPKKK